MCYFLNFFLKPCYLANFAYEVQTWIQAQVRHGDMTIFEKLGLGYYGNTYIN